MAASNAEKKTSCSELKKLQIIKRRKNTNAAVQTISPLSMAFSTCSSNTMADESENVSDTNPFAKKSKVDDTSFTESQSFKIANGPKSIDSAAAKSLFSDDFLCDLPQTNSTRNILQDDIFEPDRNIPRSVLVEKSLKTSAIFEVDKPLTGFHTMLISPTYILDSMTNARNDNLILYYRYPEAALPHQQRKMIHKALKHHKETSSSSASKEDPNLVWYRDFSENWRKALLSAFETLKYGNITTFYFVQENLTILFERCQKSHSLKAMMKLSSMALAEDLKSNGIEYKVLNVSSTETETTSDQVDIIVTHDNCEEEHDNSEGESHSHALEDHKIYIKPSKMKFVKQDIIIEGGIALAELIDFLLNQKDRHSYAILPEIYSPGPFFYGTLRRNDIFISGPCKSAGSKPIYQLKIKGCIFPGPIYNFIRELRSDDHEVNVMVEREMNTDFLSTYLQE